MEWSGVTFAALMLICGRTRCDDGTAPADLEQRSRTVRWVSLPLRAEPPGDLVVELRPEHQRPRFGEIVYGTPESRRIAVVVAETADGDFALYVDKHRDRAVTERDLVEGSGDLRWLPLPAEQIIDDVVHPYPREVLFQRTRNRSQPRVATLSTIDHTLHPDDDGTAAPMHVRQADGNGNGLYSDPRDLLLIDLNGDDRFDPFLEVFPFRPILETGGHRWFVRADPFGERLRLQSATATGRLQLRTGIAAENGRIAELVFTVEGEDGSVFSLNGAQAATDLPTGRYAASVLFGAIEPPGGGQRWEYTFSRNTPVQKSEWIEIREGETTTLDPIGKLVLDAAVTTERSDSATVLQIQPQLWTETRLLINSVHLTETSPWSGPQCQTSVINGEGRAFGAAQSGFA
jgi:hypothetical protein